MLEEAVHQVDVMIAIGQSRTSSSTTTCSGGNQFQEYVARQRKISALYKEADQLEDEADFFDDLAALNSLDEEVDEESVERLSQEAINARQKAQQLVSTIQIHTHQNLNLLYYFQIE